ncbi:hypothetical protein RFI_01127 [Reticulomyxa filosa]|uniref:Uncharacterized protein n=1 Tax=Reticulomyxa filosa TaxID=46433 RepID=X6PBR0_RETFI|nr:hypothetical protein RFI_01127 [Reticulomyxa filosa]|eukprot:ETO35935.1 hypothetical protein RFI_01127 [Reticulomyxa filosa]
MASKTPRQLKKSKSTFGRAEKAGENGEEKDKKSVMLKLKTKSVANVEEKKESKKKKPDENKTKKERKKPVMEDPKKVMGSRGRSPQPPLKGKKGESKEKKSTKKPGDKLGLNALLQMLSQCEDPWDMRLFKKLLFEYFRNEVTFNDHTQMTVAAKLSSEWVQKVSLQIQNTEEYKRLTPENKAKLAQTLQSYILNDLWNHEENMKAIKMLTDKDYVQPLEEYIGLEDINYAEDFGDLNENDFEIEPGAVHQLLERLEDDVVAPVLSAYDNGFFDNCMKRSKRRAFELDFAGCYFIFICAYVYIYLFFFFLK